MNVCHRSIEVHVPVDCPGLLRYQLTVCRRVIEEQLYVVEVPVDCRRVIEVPVDCVSRVI